MLTAPYLFPASSRRHHSGIKLATLQLVSEPDQEKSALTKLMSLGQTASVAEYKAAHDVLAAKSKLPTAQRLLVWEQGLKAEIRAECKLDP